MKQDIVFSKLKLTNNKNAESGQVSKVFVRSFVRSFVRLFVCLCVCLFCFNVILPRGVFGISQSSIRPSKIVLLLKSSLPLTRDHFSLSFVK